MECHLSLFVLQFLWMVEHRGLLSINLIISLFVVLHKHVVDKFSLFCSFPVLLIMLKSLFFCYCSNENDVTERLKRIIQANASLHQELQDTGSTSKCLVWRILTFYPLPCRIFFDINIVAWWFLFSFLCVCSYLFKFFFLDGLSHDSLMYYFPFSFFGRWSCLFLFYR